MAAVARLFTKVRIVVIKILWRSNNKIYKDHDAKYTSNSLDEHLIKTKGLWLKYYWRFVTIEPNVYRAVWKGNK